MQLTPLRYSELAARVVARHDEAAWLAHRSASRSLACYPAPHGLVSIRDGRNSTCGRNRLRGRLVEVGEGLTSLVWPCVGAAISHSSLRRIFAVHWLSAWRRCPASWRALPNGAPRRSGLGRLSQASPAGRLRGGGIPPPARRHCNDGFCYTSDYARAPSRPRHALPAARPPLCLLPPLK